MQAALKSPSLTTGICSSPSNARLLKGHIPKKHLNKLIVGARDT